MGRLTGLAARMAGSMSTEAPRFDAQFRGQGQMQDIGFSPQGLQQRGFSSNGIQASGFDPRGLSQTATFRPGGLSGAAAFRPTGVGGGAFDPRGINAGSFSPQGIMEGAFNPNPSPLAGQADGPRGIGSELFPDETGGRSAGGGWVGSGTSSDNSSITGAQVNEVINRYQAASGGKVPLAGLGDQILAIANKYGVSVPVLLGIAKKESGMGSNVGAGNIFGITDPSCDGGIGKQRCFQKYANPLAEVEAAARLLGSDTYAGKSVQDQISTWYVGRPYAEAANADDAAGNGTVNDYINKFIAPMYAEFGIQPNVSQAGQANPKSAGGIPNVPGDWFKTAQKFMGIPYTNGGIRNTGNPLDGMDCSSFVGYVMGIPRGQWNAQIQFDTTRRVGQNEAKAGDLIFFKNTNLNDASARPVSHVGIYLGNGKMIHTGGDGGVMIVDLNTDYWKSHFHGYGRMG